MMKSNVMTKTTVTVLTMFLLATTATADVRVLHASPDAPSVDVIVNGNFASPAITDLAFGAFTDYIELPSDTYNFKVVPTGATEPVVIDADVAIDEMEDYTIVASDVLNSITPLVFTDDNDTAGDMARIRFIHLSPNAPAVDIALQGGAVLFPNVAFQSSGGYISVPAGTYDLEARVAGTDSVALSVPGLAVENNTVYTVYAIGLLGDDTNPLQVAVSVDATSPRVRVVHASPDAPAVDVVVNDGFDMPAIMDLPYGEFTGYIPLPNDMYNFKVVPTGATEPVVIDADLTLEVWTDYTVIASDFLASITPLVLIDDNALIEDQARVRFVHLSPDAPAVDIAVADGGPILFQNVAFQGVGDYIAVDWGMYDLEVLVSGTDTVALELPGIMLTPNTVYTVYAIGTLAKDDAPLTAIISVDAQEFLTGDVNCDGLIHFEDIDAFVNALADPDAYDMLYPDCDRMLADINGDGFVTFDDINPFVELLAGH